MLKLDEYKWKYDHCREKSTLLNLYSIFPILLPLKGSEFNGKNIESAADFSDIRHLRKKVPTILSVTRTDKELVDRKRTRETLSERTDRTAVNLKLTTKNLSEETDGSSKMDLEIFALVLNLLTEISLIMAMVAKVMDHVIVGGAKMIVTGQEIT